jgi:nucleotide-binding universal stress UspA family protein
MRVLVATDGSEHARAAIAWFASFPIPAASTMLTLTVEPPRRLAPEARLFPHFEAFLFEAARHTADEARERLAGRFSDAEARVLRGDPREVIVQVACEWNADLVVVGARGLTGLKGLLLGSVSNAVVHWAPCPVLVVKGHPAPGVERVVVAVDGSAHALRAARFAAALPFDLRTTVAVVGVVDPPFVPLSATELPLPAIYALLEERLRERQAVITDALGEAAAEFHGRVRVVESLSKVGHPVESIVETAEEPGVELVVMGARGLGPLDRLLVGSVSDGVLRRVDRPVLIVNGRGRT